MSINEHGYPEQTGIENLQQSYERGVQDGIQQAEEESENLVNAHEFAIEKVTEAIERGITLEILLNELESESLRLQPVTGPTLFDQAKY